MRAKSLAPRCYTLGLAFLLLSLFLIPATAKADVQFATVATSNAIGGLGLSIPSINDEGTVVFIDTSSGGSGIYTGNGGPLTTIATSSIFFAPYSSGGGYAWGDLPAPAINDAGVVAFYVRTDASDGQGILSGTQSGLTTIVTSPGPAGNPNALTGAPLIDDAGSVVYLIHFPTSNLFVTGTGVFTGSGGVPTTIISSDSSSAGLTVIDPAISHNGTIAYEWRGPTTSSGFTDSLYTLHNGVTTLITSTQPESLTSFATLAVNDAGTVLASTGRTLEMGNSTSFGTLSTLSLPISAIDTVAINDANLVAFRGLLSSGGTAIYTHTDSGFMKVIAFGDAFDGSFVTALAMSREAINDRGQVTFWAKLANGEQGIFVASPEPSSLALLITALGIGLFAYLARRRRLTTISPRSVQSP
jgi:hypothetical protein